MSAWETHYILRHYFPHPHSTFFVETVNVIQYQLSQKPVERAVVGLKAMELVNRKIVQLIIKKKTTRQNRLIVSEISGRILLVNGLDCDLRKLMAGSKAIFLDLFQKTTSIFNICGQIVLYIRFPVSKLTFIQACSLM